ncbi:hypothetical protein EV360DRAFT_91809 [Lentinula raphanica]|nr:hypothetical protein EV360DRAFT_91809 [Lentinula raphanica]
MGSSKKQSKSYRTRTTRSSGRSNLLPSDPLQNTAQLNDQLRSLGLYAAPTIGDGNCLFRALSDQYYGSPSRHVEVRREICDFIEAHPERYEGFVDVDEFGDSGVRKGKGGGLSAYVAGMRQNATYGGHMELSAFAHLTKRNIKVVQPGLVYVIQCDPSQPKRDFPSIHTRSGPSKELDADETTTISPVEDQDSTIYVAYHDWEHFSSVRNLRGPHTGVPRVHETAPPPTASSSSKQLPPSKARKKERERREKEKKDAGRLKAKEKATSNSTSNSSSKPKSKAKDKQVPVTSAQQTTGFKLKIPPRSVLAPPTLYMTAPTPISAGASPLSSLPPSPIEESDGLLDASTIPLPSSAPHSVAHSPPVSPSPSPAPATSSEQPSSDSEDAVMDSPSVDLSATITLPKSTQSTTEDDSSEEPGTNEPGSSLHAHSGSECPEGFESPEEENDDDDDDDDDYVDEEETNEDDHEDEDDLVPNLNHAHSIVPPKIARHHHTGVSVSPERPLTRRQRKKLGLPKPRNAPVSNKGLGKIIIPGGKSKLPRDASSAAEWTANGNGRVDVRGFRELKI